VVIMNEKWLVFIIVVIAIVAAYTGAVTLGVFAQTTDVDNKFISAKIPTIAIENEELSKYDGWEEVFKDSKTNTSYYFFMAVDLDFYVEMFEYLGAKKIATKEYNNVKWDIYYINPKDIKNWDDDLDNRSRYLAITSGKNGDYGITIASDLKFNETLDSDLFTDYVEPLLNSIFLKDPKDPIKQHKIMNMSETDFNLIKTQVKENGWDSIFR